MHLVVISRQHVYLSAPDLDIGRYVEVPLPKTPKRLQISAEYLNAVVVGITHVDTTIHDV